MGQPAVHEATPQSPKKKHTRSIARWGDGTIPLGLSLAKSARKGIERELVHLATHERGPLVDSEIAVLAVLVDLCTFSNMLVDEPHEAVAALAGVSVSSVYRVFARLAPLGLLEHETVTPADMPKGRAGYATTWRTRTGAQRRRHHAIRSAAEVGVPKCTKDVRWTTLRDGRAVPSCPGCVWHHGGAVTRLLFNSAAQLRKLLRSVPARLVRTRGRVVGTRGLELKRPGAVKAAPTDRGFSVSWEPVPQAQVSQERSPTLVKPGRVTALAADAPSAPGPSRPLLSPPPAPRTAPAAPSRNTAPAPRPPVADAAPPPAKALDGFASASVGESKSFEGGGSPAASSPRLAADVERVGRAHREHVLRRPGVPLLTHERVLIAAALASGLWDGDSLVDAMRGARLREHDGMSRRAVGFLFSDQDGRREARLLACIEAWRARELDEAPIQIVTAQAAIDAHRAMTPAELAAAIGARGWERES